MKLLYLREGGWGVVHILNHENLVSSYSLRVNSKGRMSNSSKCYLWGTLLLENESKLKQRLRSLSKLSKVN